MQKSHRKCTCHKYHAVSSVVCQSGSFLRSDVLLRETGQKTRNWKPFIAKIKTWNWDGAPFYVIWGTQPLPSHRSRGHRVHLFRSFSDSKIFRRCRFCHPTWTLHGKDRNMELKWGTILCHLGHTTIILISAQGAHTSLIQGHQWFHNFQAGSLLPPMENLSWCGSKHGTGMGHHFWSFGAHYHYPSIGACN